MTPIGDVLARVLGRLPPARAEPRWRETLWLIGNRERLDGLGGGRMGDGGAATGLQPSLSDLDPPLAAP
jgi:hypothetical protein